jgi:hypothetical protein
MARYLLPGRPRLPKLVRDLKFQVCERHNTTLEYPGFSAVSRQDVGSLIAGGAFLSLHPGDVGCLASSAALTDHRVDIDGLTLLGVWPALARPSSLIAC